VEKVACVLGELSRQVACRSGCIGNRSLEGGCEQDSRNVSSGDRAADLGRPAG
jgi:hypothetical protein